MINIMIAAIKGQKNIHAQEISLRTGTLKALNIITNMYIPNIVITN